METFFLLLRCSCYSFIVSFAVTVTEMDFHWISNLRRRRKVVGKIEKRAKYDISTLAISLDRDLGLFPYTMRTFLIAHTSLRKVSAEKKIKRESFRYCGRRNANVSCENGVETHGNPKLEGNFVIFRFD